jgi:hypothetical protein
VRPLTVSPAPTTTPQSHRSQVPSTGLGSITVYDPRLLGAVATATATASGLATRPPEGA